MLEDVLQIRRVVLACGTVDLRKGIDGLAMIIGDKYKQNPFEKGTLFLFCGQRSDRIKGLVWQETGFILLYYDLKETRIEGETCTYFTALINADGVDGFIMCGPGTIDGNGLRSWKAFWLRRKWNPKCTNKDEQRPRLVYLSNCRNVLVADLSLQNAHFWTNHLYRCDHVKYLNCNIFSPATPVKSPSTDALDIDVCTDVLVKGCYMEVNDDSVVLKGGKGYVLYGKCTEKFHRKIMVYWLEASEEEVLE